MNKILFFADILKPFNQGFFIKVANVAILSLIGFE